MAYSHEFQKFLFKPAFSFDDAYRIIVDGSGKHFDPDVVQAFVSEYDRFQNIANTYAE